MHEISLKNVMRLLVNHKIPIEIIVAKIGYKTVYTKEQLLKTLHNRTQHFLQIENDVKSLLFLSHKQKRS